MNPMREPVIRPARDEDLAALVEELEQEEFFADRLARQAAGQGLLLTAWQEHRPIGDVYLWWEPAEEPEIRAHLPGVPLLNHLEVHPTFRKHGTGTRLTRAAERELAARDHRRVALAVEESNTDAMRLYERLDYREWAHRKVTCLTHPENGRTRSAEICHVLVKDLSRPHEA
jgi:ribosomal protein S18 acetylase RimI-like enzyme